MKNFFLLFLIIFNFIYIITCEKENEEDENIKQMVNYYIEKLGYKGMKTITREEFRKLFLLLFENKQKDSEENKEDSDIMFSLTNSLFDFIVSEDKQKIDMDKIYDYFEPNNIIKALKELLKQLGMEKLIDSISEPLLESLKQKNKSDSFVDRDKINDL